MTTNIITPTSDRPAGMDKLEASIIKYTQLGRCTGSLIWTVADDGEEPWIPKCRMTIAPCSSSETIVRKILGRTPAPDPVTSFRCNLLAAIQHVEPGFVIVAEDDDHYDPRHFTDMIRRLESGALACGDTQQRYYHLTTQHWKQYTNRGACLAQTAFRTELLPLFQQAILNPESPDGRGVDAAFWKAVVQFGLPYDLFNGDAESTPFVVGIKGLPGKPGIGLGHKPDQTWTADPDFDKLRQWTGDDAAEHYIQLAGQTNGTHRSP